MAGPPDRGSGCAGDAPLQPQPASSSDEDCSEEDDRGALLGRDPKRCRGLAWRAALCLAVALLAAALVALGTGGSREAFPLEGNVDVFIEEVAVARPKGKAGAGGKAGGKAAGKAGGAKKAAAAAKQKGVTPIKNRAKLEAEVKQQHLQAVCVANIFSGLWHLADVGATAVAASRNCPIGHSDALIPSPAVAAAQVALDDVEDLVGQAQALLNGSNSTGAPSAPRRRLGIANFDELRRALQNKATPAELLEKAAEGIDTTRGFLDIEAIKTSEFDLYGVKRQAQIRCARDALYMSKAVSAAGARLSTAGGICPKDRTPDSVQRARCSAQVQSAISTVSLVGGEIARMVQLCRPDFPLTACNNRLEALSWQIATASRFMSGAVTACSGKPLHREITFILDYGWCIGEIFSTMGYIAASALWIVQISRDDCVKAHEWAELRANRTLTIEEQRLAQIARSKCIAGAFSFLRVIFLGMVKGARSGAHCADFSVRCPRDVMRSTSAFAGIAQASSFAYQKCTLPEGFNETPDELRDRAPDCANEIGSTIKLLGIALSFLTDATGSCVGNKFAETRCGASIFRSMAAFGALTEIMATIQRDCVVRDNFFQCGRNMRWMAESLRVLTLAMSTAVLNCGLPPHARQWKSTPPVAMPRFFTFP